MCTCLCVCELALKLTGSVREIDNEDRVLDLQGLVQQQPLVVAHPLFASHGWPSESARAQAGRCCTHVRRLPVSAAPLLRPQRLLPVPRVGVVAAREPHERRLQRAQRIKQVAPEQPLDSVLWPSARCWPLPNGVCQSNHDGCCSYRREQRHDVDAHLAGSREGHEQLRFGGGLRRGQRAAVPRPAPQAVG